MNVLTPGMHVSWSSYRPYRSFSGIVRKIGKRTAHVQLKGQHKLRWVKIGRLTPQ